MQKKIQEWKNLIRFILYFFQISGLSKTLFVPWHRDEYKREPGIWGFFEKIGFSIMTRFIGFVIRAFTIIVGIISLLFTLLLFPFFMLFPISISFEKMAQKYGSLGREWAYPITYTLDKHGRDMRKMPEYLVLDHDNSIKQIERTLARKTQQNVLVIGSQGIGKTTRLGYLARKMYRDLSHPALNGKRLVELFPEEMEVSEIEKVIKEAIYARNVVLVIENIERFNILGILEPYMDNNHFQMILTTDYSSYHQKFKHHGNLMRVSEVVEFLPPNDEITMLYLIDWCKHNKEYRFADDTLAAIVILTDKLIMNAYQPEKSIDILEELSSFPDSEITPEHVEELISQKTGVPIGVLQDDEKEKLIHLEDVLKSHVIGQDQAVHAIASSLKRARAGVVDSKKPIGSFLFLGTTGVGKTHTAKMLAQYYFGAENMMSRFDMSEFRELDSMNRFIERLGTMVEDRPYSLVFFDEIEKAHSDILNLFLQILDEGSFHAVSGRFISFRNTIIICTSNAGADYMMANNVDSQDLLIEYIVSNGILRPEFINRFDATILYKALSRDSIEKVARIMLGDLNRHLDKKQNLTIRITDELVKTLARKGHDLKFGVRPLRRLIQDEVETVVADRLLTDNIPGNRIIEITLSE